MHIINIAYQYRIYPTKEQIPILANQFGQARFVYNYFLNKRIDFYTANKEKEKQSLSYYDTAKMLTQLKKQEDFCWLVESNSQSLQQSLKNLDTAYKHFFRDKFNFPKFKKKNNKQSFLVPQNFEIDTEKRLLHIPKLTAIKVVLHRKFEGTTKSVTITKTPSGKYFVSVLCRIERDIPIKKTGNKVGIDLGLHSFVVTSSGEKIDSPKFLRKSETKLSKMQKQLSKKKKGSKNRNKARIKVALMHERITNQRQDFLHKLSTRLVSENQAIFAEDLNVKGILSNSHLSKSVSDSGWSEFTRQLKYKSDWSGVQFHQVDRFFPSSKRCFHCGKINTDLTLANREWVCGNCGVLLDRDINSAKNILEFGTTELDNQKTTNKVGRDATELKRLGRSRVVKRVAELRST